MKKAARRGSAEGFEEWWLQPTEEDATENGTAEAASEDKTKDSPPTQAAAARDTGMDTLDASTPDSQSSSKPSSSSKGGEASGGERRAYPVMRRRKSLWFGSYRRHVIRQAAAAALPGHRKAPTVIDKAASRSSAKRRRSSSDGAGKNCDSALPAAKIVAKDKSPSTETRQAAAPTRSKDASPDAAESSKAQPKATQAEESRVREDTENASSGEAEPATIEQVLQLNRGWLEELEDRTVTETEGATVEQLERLYCALLNVVRHHRRSWDRNVMLLPTRQSPSAPLRRLAQSRRTRPFYVAEASLGSPATPVRSPLRTPHFCIAGATLESPGTPHRWTSYRSLHRLQHLLRC
ncbi:hypothetical protein HPB50_003967 [Hyalomma asiaticum]|uniref:Uncharacterized protein n=1 Tax=Hyalomma asiaticum TaxID=266040 RepID=A0ACB7RIU2_HYAAI|nr:hypothetical protein HPB50_003967 [Hyalomma asiaticum]